MRNASEAVLVGRPAKVLIVDDLEDVRWALSNLTRQAGFTPLEAANGEDALVRIRQDAPDVLLVDVGLPGIDGFEVLNRARAIDKRLRVIMITGNGNTQDAVRAVRSGAYDYVAKPFNNEDIVLTLRRALQEQAMRKQHWKFPVQSMGQVSSLQDAMGRSAAIGHIQTEVERVAKTNFSVLVTGESGTGKELVSQAIHAQSTRAGKPFVAVDCGAIAESLIESELFGHEKGAFTGAHQAKAGAFELADSGTIFLDEIGNLPLALQGKLLRVLETRKIHRIGSTKEIDVQFRVVAATNADLLSMVAEQKFRGDLYHRLAEYAICLPPLRERKKDLVFLANRFLAQTSKELGKPVHGLSTAAWGLVQNYSWPGNARELRNQLRRAVLLCDDPNGMITPENLGMLTGRSSPPQAGLPGSSAVQGEVKSGRRACPLCDPEQMLALGVDVSLKVLSARAVAQTERAILLRALTLTGGNKAQAARMLHIDYKTIHSKLKAYQISSTPFMNDPYQGHGQHTELQ